MGDPPQKIYVSIVDIDGKELDSYQYTPPGSSDPLIDRYRTDHGKGKLQYANGDDVFPGEELQAGNYKYRVTGAQGLTCAQGLTGAQGQDASSSNAGDALAPCDFVALHLGLATRQLLHWLDSCLSLAQPKEASFESSPQQHDPRAWEVHPALTRRLPRAPHMQAPL